MNWNGTVKDSDRSDRGMEGEGEREDSLTASADRNCGEGGIATCSSGVANEGDRDGPTAESVGTGMSGNT